MIMSCPKHTTTRAIHLLRFVFITPPKNRTDARMITITGSSWSLLHGLSGEVGRLRISDNINGYEERRAKVGSGLCLAADSAVQSAEPPHERRPVGHAVQALFDPRIHPRPPRHQPAGAGELTIHGRELGRPDPERARSGPILDPPPGPKRPSAAHRRDHRCRSPRPRTRGQGSGEPRGRGAQGALG